ncbi:SAC domain containing protein [Musa troglodytarum]|uniref:SAC domain containing protein n=1 Tax=Musa troglodytarum TaxID=320322 RepID=A0A9E7J9R9_9LILI|nr:SAC domain containing protein [Musa troglodytarum]
MAAMEEADAVAGAGGGRLQIFILYAARSMFLVVGSDESRKQWRVLKIDRSQPSELSIHEDPITYSKSECKCLLEQLDHENNETGGLNKITVCYGIVGFVKFLGPYYMLLVTGRKKIGAICGHAIYAVTRSQMISLSDSAQSSSLPFLGAEYRYKRLLRTVDLTKDFFFSYSYSIMCSLQKNMCDGVPEAALHETMFVWNEANFLMAAEISHSLSLPDDLDILLAPGYRQLFSWMFHEVLDSVCADHRYLRRGVDEKGRVANDVETEQIVFCDQPDEIPREITSVVQNRGSIPLFWSQETRRLGFKPDIILEKKDDNFEATRLHFENLVNRYENPIIVLSMIKKQEKKPRESLLTEKLVDAINHINKDLPESDRLIYFHWDFQSICRRRSTEALALLCKVAACAMDLTGFFHCRRTPTSDDALDWLSLLNDDSEQSSDISQSASSSCRTEQDGNGLAKPLHRQKGVLRTNCIDCLDRTNAAQIAYGLTALGHQLHALGIKDVPEVDLEDPLADHLMNFYREMGDRLALQYVGSAAHDKIPHKNNGRWVPQTLWPGLQRNLQRYYSHAFMDARKQKAINLFLGHFVPQRDKPELCDLDSDQHHDVGRSHFRKSLSVGSVTYEVNTDESNTDVRTRRNVISELLSYMDLDENDMPYSRPLLKRYLSDSTIQHEVHTYASVCDATTSNHVISELPSTMPLNGSDLSSSREMRLMGRFTKLGQFFANLEEWLASRKRHRSNWSLFFCLFLGLLRIPIEEQINLQSSGLVANEDTQKITDWTINV